MTDLVSQLKALGEPNRLGLCVHLAQEELSGVDLLARAPTLSQPSLSRHLRVLNDAGLIHENKQGRRVLYRLVPGELIDLVLRLASGERRLVRAENMSEQAFVGPESVKPGEPEDFQEWLR